MTVSTQSQLQRYRLKTTIGLTFVWLCFLLKTTDAKYIDGRNGGFKCLGCTYVISMVDQLSVIHKEPASKSFRRFCSYLPYKVMVDPCYAVADLSGIYLDVLFKKGGTPDTICHSLTLCFKETDEYCHLFPLKKKSFETLIAEHETIRKGFPEIDEARDRLIKQAKIEKDFPESAMPFICRLPVFKILCDAYEKARKHFPVFDSDNDYFSRHDSLRGAFWRGKDCNDTNSNIYPGRRPVNSDINTDTNCNGIHGSDPKTKQPYEDIYCKNTGQRGFAIVGDSVAAHFSIPPEWFTASTLSKVSFNNLLETIANELDWPQLSGATGYMETSSQIFHNTTDSFYYLLWKRNHCIHRDFQNIGVNGAKSESLMQNVKSLSRNQTSDFPLVVFYAVVGNDVCNKEIDTLKYMTTPEDMYKNTMTTLKYLDTILPAGSHVILNGLVHGTILYDIMHNHTHPVGKTRNDVKYSDFYRYLRCLGKSMCSGWLSNNATLRNFTMQHANKLSAVLESISIKENHFKHFKLYFIGGVFTKAKKYLKKYGKKYWQIIEPTDGFHNNEVGQAIASRVVWDTFMEKHPEIIGPINPHNEKIRKIFKNQGGY